MVRDGPINGDWFEVYVDQIVVPNFMCGNVVLMDNLSSHKRASVHDLIEAASARLLFLPPYSPNFNPIEKAFARLKAMLRKAGDRIMSRLWSSIGSWSISSSRKSVPTISAPAAIIRAECNLV